MHAHNVLVRGVMHRSLISTQGLSRFLDHPDFGTARLESSQVPAMDFPETYPVQGDDGAGDIIHRRCSFFYTSCREQPACLKPI